MAASLQTFSIHAGVRPEDVPWANISSHCLYQLGWTYVLDSMLASVLQAGKWKNHEFSSFAKARTKRRVTSSGLKSEM